MAQSTLGTRYTTRAANPGFIIADPAVETTAHRSRVKNLFSARTLGYVLFVSIFAVEMGIAALHPDALLALQPWQWLVFGLAAFRGARALSYNGVFGWLREPFTDVEPDSSGAGDSVVPRHGARGLLYVIGDCLACPICTGTHVGGLLITLTALFPTYGLFLTYGLAVAGLAEIVHWHTERDEWQGRAAREAAGTEWLAKNRPMGDSPRRY